MDQLRAMRVFSRVIDAGGFAKAAVAMDIAPAVATRLVAELEEHLGARLINRTTRRLALTDVGEEYLERVRSILSEVDDAEAVAGIATAEARGRVCVLAPPGFTVHQLTKHLPRFRAMHPKVSLELTVLPSVETPDENHDLTIIVQRAKPIEGAFIARRIATSEVVLCATPEYLDRHGRPRHPRHADADAAQRPARAELKAGLGRRGPGGRRAEGAAAADDDARRHALRRRARRPGHRRPAVVHRRGRPARTGAGARAAAVAHADGDAVRRHAHAQARADAHAR